MPAPTKLNWPLFGTIALLALDETVVAVLYYLNWNIL